jgi:hypothetical protein
MSAEKTLENKYSHSTYICPIYPSFFLAKEAYGLQKSKVIDLGASDGRYLAHFGPGSKGVEYSETDRKSAIEKGYDVVPGNLNRDFDFFPNESFDFLFCSHVIEHLESPYLFLKKARAYGGDGAKLVLGYPLEYSLVRLLGDPYFGHDGHVYSFSLANMRKLMAEAGFEIERVFYDIPFATRFAPFRLLQRWVQHLPAWAVTWWASALYVVAKKI